MREERENGLEAEVRNKGVTYSLQTQWSMEPTGLERVRERSERREQSCGIRSQRLTWAYLGFQSPACENTDSGQCLHCWQLEAGGPVRCECRGRELAGFCFQSCL